MTQDNTDSNKWTRRGVIGATAATAAATVPASAAAQTGDESASALFADEEFSRTRMGVAFIEGLVDNLSDRVQAPNAEVGIETLVSDAVSEFESHQDEWVDYVNERDLGASDRQVLKLTFSHDGATRSRAVVAEYDADAGAYQSVSIVSETDQAADATAKLYDYATENAADELQELHEQFIGPDKDIPRSYFSRLAGKYWQTDHITASFLGGT